MNTVDVVVVGSGPNGLAAAVTLAGAGLSVTVVEGADRPGRRMPDRGADPARLPPRRVLRRPPHGPVVPLLPAAGLRQAAGHPLPAAGALRPAHRRSRAVAAFRSLDETVAALGGDGPAYRRLMEPLVRDSQSIADDVLGSVAVHSRPSGGHGPVRSTRPHAHGLVGAPVPIGGGQGPAGRCRRPLDVTDRPADQRVREPRWPCPPTRSAGRSWAAAARPSPPP